MIQRRHFKWTEFCFGWLNVFWRIRSQSAFLSMYLVKIFSGFAQNRCQIFQWLSQNNNNMNLSFRRNIIYGPSLFLFSHKNYFIISQKIPRKIPPSFRIQILEMRHFLIGSDSFKKISLSLSGKKYQRKLIL